MPSFYIGNNKMIYSKEILSAIAIILALIAYLPYIVSISNGKTKPHVFSWIIWSIVTTVIFFAQLYDNGGVGSYPIGVSAALAIYVAILAYKHKSDINITTMDKISFVTAILTIPLWYIINSPLYSVIILTIIDILAFIPTFRKSYNSPHSEKISLYFVTLFRNFLSAIALENYSIITLTFPIATTLVNLIFILMLYKRRRIFQEVIT